MVNGVMGYSTYYNNNESLLRGVEASNEAEQVARASIPVKAAMKEIGYDCGGCRLPLCQMQTEKLNILKKHL